MVSVWCCGKLWFWYPTVFWLLSCNLKHRNLTPNIIKSFFNSTTASYYMISANPLIMWETFDWSQTHTHTVNCLTNSDEITIGTTSSARQRSQNHLIHPVLWTRAQTDLHYTTLVRHACLSVYRNIKRPALHSLSLRDLWQNVCVCVRRVIVFPWKLHHIIMHDPHARGNYMCDVLCLF